MDVRTPRSCSCRPSTARPTLEAAPRASPADDHPGDRRRGLWPPADCVNIDSHTCLVLLEAGHALLRPTQPLYGDGQNVRDWLYGEDHVDRPGHDRRYAIDPTRISSELGWQPRHSFEEGLAATGALVSGAAGVVPAGARSGRLWRRPAGSAGGGWGELIPAYAPIVV